MKKPKYFLVMLTFLTPFLSVAQSADGGKNIFETYQMEIVLSLAAIVCFVAFLALLVAWSGLRAVIRKRMEEQGLVMDDQLIKARPGEEHLGFWGRIWSRMNGGVPIAEEESIATDHVYDGIVELDNRLPPWWLYMFYITIIFSVGYWVHYEVLGTGKTQDQEFREEMVAAEQLKKSQLASNENVVDESNVVLLTDQVELDAGAKVYLANCAMCHGADGGGGIGPNFTDKYWLNGGDIVSIFKTIKYGVPAKGMIPWESQLSPTQIQQVASFIYGLEGTTPQTAKEAQGELVEREVVAPSEGQ